MEQFSLEEYLANPSRKVVTRNGYPVRIICTDANKYNYPIIALVSNKSGIETVLGYTKKGTIIKNRQHDEDLFFALENHEEWINLYKSGINWSLGASIWQTEEEAKNNNGNNQRNS